MQIIELLQNGSKKLKINKISSHRLDAELLLSNVLNRKREDLLVNLNLIVKSKKIKKFDKLIKRRLNKEPIPYILKKREFWSKDYFVNKGVLIPRPETELMVEKVIKVFKNRNINILDIGTGSGCILLSIVSELKGSKGIGIDISKHALKVAYKNLEKHNLSNRIKFYKKSVNEICFKKFDLIVSNPPYILKKDIKNLDDDVRKFEPKIALDGGNDGLDVIRKVIYKSENILKIKGMLALEIGNGQFKKVSKILRERKFRIKYLIRDYQENIRCILSILET